MALGGRVVVFNSEAELVQVTVSHLRSGRSPWGSVQFVTEWNYRNGRADILARTSCNSLIAFEAKLSRWQIACHQAYRNTVYATKAYVVLPEDAAHRAFQSNGRFKKMFVGLCVVTATEIRVLIEPPPALPLMRWVTDLAHSTFDGLNDAATESRSGRRTSLCNA